MTLLELLRQELPKRGGWPEGVTHICQDGDKYIGGYTSNPMKKSAYDWGDEGYVGDSGEYSEILADDHATAIVTREQYEATCWDGTGLPPVGVECESKQFAQINWHKFRVVATENGHVFGFWNDKVGVCLDSNHWEFRPLRTEAERAIDEMVRLSGVSIGAAKILYDAVYRK